MVPCSFCHKPFKPTALPPAKEAITCSSCCNKYYSGKDPDTEPLGRDEARTAASRTKRTSKPKELPKTEPVDPETDVEDSDLEQARNEVWKPIEELDRTNLEG